MMQMVNSFAEFERAMLRERTRAGLESARGEGRVGGRRPKLLPQQQTEVLKMVRQGKKTAADAARLSSTFIPQRLVDCLHAKASMRSPVRGRLFYGAA